MTTAIRVSAVKVGGETQLSKSLLSSWNRLGDATAEGQSSQTGLARCAATDEEDDRNTELPFGSFRATIESLDQPDMGEKPP